jgi:hypothetical protein
MYPQKPADVAQRLLSTLFGETTEGWQVRPYSLSNPLVLPSNSWAQGRINAKLLGVGHRPIQTIPSNYLHPAHPLVARHLGQLIGNLFGELDLVV